MDIIDLKALAVLDRQLAGMTDDEHFDVVALPPSWGPAPAGGAESAP